MAWISERTSSAGVENHRSMERFINPYANQYMTTTGTNESSSAPATMRVRNFEPRTPMRRSANSFSRLRNRTKVKATNNSEMRKVRAQKTRISSLLPGRRKLGSKAFCETRMASKSKTAMASRMMARLRLEDFRVRVGAGSRTGLGVAAETDSASSGRWEPL